MKRFGFRLQKNRKLGKQLEASAIMNAEGGHVQAYFNCLFFNFDRSGAKQWKIVKGGGDQN